ncbi:hypothetical protein [Zavarzinia sp. CC-PAN008]|uniref:hypothetical protein n=1 Tax=Zavarzinia sp. CC-PAN008 TaxID=3243332 RepID=UPI003F74930E
MKISRSFSLWAMVLREAESAGGGGGGTPPASAPPAAPAFMDTLPEEYRADPTFLPFKESGLGALAKSYKNAAGLLGLDKAHVLRMPVKDDDPAWGDVYSRLGRPEKVDGYELPTVEGMPEVAPEHKAAWLKAAHDAGVTKRQAAAMWEAYGKTAAAVMQQGQQAETARSAEVEQQLRAELGGAYDARVKGARDAVIAYGGQELADYLSETGLGNDPRMFKLFDKLARNLTPETLVKGPGAALAGPRSPNEAKAEIRKREGDAEFMKRYHNAAHPAHGDALQEMADLYKAAFPA